MLSNEAALFPKTQVNEPRVLDDDVLQPEQFFQVQGLSTGLADGTAPSLDSALRRLLSFDIDTQNSKQALMEPVHRVIPR